MIYHFLASMASRCTMGGSILTLMSEKLCFCSRLVYSEVDLSRPLAPSIMEMSNIRAGSGPSFSSVSIFSRTNSPPPREYNFNLTYKNMQYISRCRQHNMNVKWKSEWPVLYCNHDGELKYYFGNWSLLRNTWAIPDFFDYVILFLLSLKILETNNTIRNKTT